MALPPLTWKTLPIGAGGLISSIQIAPNGAKIIRTDTYGAYVCTVANPIWRQLYTASSMPLADDLGYDAAGELIISEGIVAVAIAPSNTNRLYMFYLGRLYRSDDFGLTFFETNFTRVTPLPNEGNNLNVKFWGHKMEVKPDDPDVVYLGTSEDGLFFTDDGGDTWSSVAGIPEATDIHGYSVSFDANTPGTVFVFSYGNGVYRSTSSASGAGFSAIADSPTTFRTSKVDADGKFWVAVNATGTDDSLYSWNGVSWASYEISAGTDNSRVQSFVVDPNDTDHIIAVIESGHSAVSTNGVDFTDINFGELTITASDVPWLGTQIVGNQAVAECQIDPTNGRMYFVSGTGMFWTDDLAGGAMVWNSQNAGIEQLVTNKIMSRGSNLFVDCWDRPTYKVNGIDYATNYNPQEAKVAIVAGWALDTDPDDDDFVVSLNNWFGSEYSAVSANGGSTWTLFDAYPPLESNSAINGHIAVASPTNWVWIPCNFWGRPWYTTDAGATWNLWTPPAGTGGSGAGNITASISGTTLTVTAVADGLLGVGEVVYWPSSTRANNATITALGSGTGGTGTYTISPSSGTVGSQSMYFGSSLGMGFAFFLDSQYLDRDWVSGLFYLYVQGDMGTPANYRGVYTSPTGQTWTRVSSTVMANGGANFWMKSVPGNEGHLYRTAGDSGGSISGVFERSTDGGANWSTVSGVTEVQSFGFGAPEAGGSGYPSIWALTFIGGTHCVAVSYDEGGTWNVIPNSEYPNNSLDYPTCIEGDASNPYRCYVGFRGSGAAYLSEDIVQSIYPRMRFYG